MRSIKNWWNNKPVTIRSVLINGIFVLVAALIGASLLFKREKFEQKLTIQIIDNNTSKPVEEAWIEILSLGINGTTNNIGIFQLTLSEEISNKFTLTVKKEEYIPHDTSLSVNPAGFHTILIEQKIVYDTISVGPK